MRHNPGYGIMAKLMAQRRKVRFRCRARWGTDEGLAWRQVDGVRRWTVIGPAATMMDGCAGRGDESLGLFDRRDDRHRRRFDRRGHEAVHLLGGEDGRGTREKAGCRPGVIGLGIGGNLELLVKHHEGGFLTLAYLRAGRGPLLVGAPSAGAVTEFLGISPERHNVDAAIGFIRGDVDGSQDAAGGAMPR
jgi:hypothetical protein